MGQQTPLGLDSFLGKMFTDSFQDVFPQLTAPGLISILSVGLLEAFNDTPVR
jgi:hypothetical protein